MALEKVYVECVKAHLVHPTQDDLDDVNDVMWRLELARFKRRAPFMIAGLLLIVVYVLMELVLFFHRVYLRIGKFTTFEQLMIAGFAIMFLSIIHGGCDMVKWTYLVYKS